MSDNTETTREAVRRVAAEMLLAGELPTGREVLSRVGKGSFNTIYDELKLWAKDSGQALMLPELPAALKDLVLGMWRQAVTAAAAEHLPRIEAQAQELQGLQEQAQALREEVQRSASVHQVQMEDALATADAYRQQVTEVTTVNADQRAQINHLQQVIDDLRGQVDQANKAAEEARDFFQEESRKMADQFSAMESRVMADADAAKEAAKQTVENVQATLRREQATATQRQTENARQIDELKQRIFLQDQRFESITLQNSKLQVELTQARAGAQHAIQENTLLRDTNATLKAVIAGFQSKTEQTDKDQ